MLGIFKKGLAEPPQELNSPASLQAAIKPKLPQQTLEDFLSSHPSNAFSLGFGDQALLAFAPPERSLSTHDQRFFSGLDDIYCIFLGSLKNLVALNKQYGLSKGANGAMFVIEAYRTLRDRGPYPAHEVLNDLDGSFGFVVYDTKAKTVFAALGVDEGVELFWGLGSDGCVVISDNLEVIKPSCPGSFAPFPAGCMYHNKRGLMSFEDPIHNMKAMPRADSEEFKRGANFKMEPNKQSSNTIHTSTSNPGTSCTYEGLTPLRTSKTENNPGSQFIGSPNYQTNMSCEWSNWVDSPTSPRGRVFGSMLLRKKLDQNRRNEEWQRMNKEIYLSNEELMSKNKALERMNKELKFKNQEMQKRNEVLGSQVTMWEEKERTLKVLVLVVVVLFAIWLSYYKKGT